VNGIDWYAARAAGVVAYALLTSGVLLGVLLAGRVRVPWWPQFAVTDVHRFVALLTSGFLLLHIYALILDKYVPTSPVAVLVPGGSSYRPAWVALGTIAFELLAVVGISNLARKQIGHARWRRVHYLTFLVWAFATAHGIGAGTDTGAEWLHLLYVASVASVTAAVAWRLGSRRIASARGSRPQPSRTS
jgi:methionine sulfoxide reductase heme-binding subunit